MKVKDLKHFDLLIMADNHPEWMAYNQFDWMADYRPKWMAYNQPEWMATYRPEWMTANRPYWMANNQSIIEVPEDIMKFIKR